MPYSIETEANTLTVIDAHGALDQDAVERDISELISEESHTPPTLLLRLQHMDLSSLHQIASHFVRRPEFFSLQSLLTRVAVLTDQNWIKQSVKLNGAAVPGLEIEVFDLADEVDARIWLEETETAEAA